MNENPLHAERISLNNASGRKAAPDPPKKRLPTTDIEELKKRADAERS